MKKKTAGLWISMLAGLLLCGACMVPGRKEPATPTPVPSAEPTQVVTVSPLPSKTPVPTEAALTVSPQPSQGVQASGEATPTPQVNRMIGNGWQSVDDLAGCCRIVFPERFLTGMVGGDETEIVFQYRAEETDVEFFIRYFYEKNYEEMKAELSDIETREESFFDTERSLSYTREDGNCIYKGRMIEHNEDVAAGTDGWKLLVLELKYPKEEREHYETEEFSYYIVRRQ